MSSIASTATSGLHAAQRQLDAVAHNVANLQTEGFHRQQVQQQARASGGVDAWTRRAPEPGAALEADVVQQLAARNAFVANAVVFRTADRLAGVLLDERA
jgi:flagellar hook protein FlgE